MFLHVHIHKPGLIDLSGQLFGPRRTWAAGDWPGQPTQSQVLENSLQKRYSEICKADLSDFHEFFSKYRILV